MRLLCKTALACALIWWLGDMVPYLSFWSVARGGHDPVMAANVMNSLVDKETQARIVEECNRRLMLHWLRRCEDSPAPTSREEGGREETAHDTPGDGGAGTD